MSEDRPLISPRSADGKALLELLYTAYGVPRTARKVVLTIEASGPIQITVDYLPEDTTGKRLVDSIRTSSKT